MKGKKDFYMNNKVDLSMLELSDKEKRILEAAISIFNKKGFSATTTNEIAKQAGVAEGTIFRYFKTKKDILSSLIVHMINLMSHKVVLASIEKILTNSSNMTIEDVLRNVISDRLSLVTKFFPLFKVVMSEALFHEDIREALYNNILVKANEIFKPFYERMVESGQIRNDIDYSIIVRSVIGNIVMFILPKMLYPDKLKPLEQETEVNQIISVLMSGVSSKE